MLCKNEVTLQQRLLYLRPPAEHLQEEVGLV